MFWIHRIRFFSFIVLVLLCCVIPLKVTYENVAKKSYITKQIALHLKDINISIDNDTANRISKVLYEESIRYGLDYRLVLALMKIESNFKHDAVSPKGARGLLQVKPSVAKFVALDAGIKWDGHKTLDEPASNIRIGIHFFSQLLRDFKNTALALKAYNMGPTKVKELPLKNIQPKSGFSGLVMNEYEKNTSTFPNP